MGNFFTYSGAAMDGYDKGIRQRKDREYREDDREWLEGRRRRQVEQEEIYDPMDREQRELGLKGARRSDSYSEFNDPYARRGVQRGERREIMADEDTEFMRPLSRRAATRADEAGDMDMSDRRFAQPYNRRGIVRNDERDELAWYDEEVIDRPQRIRRGQRTDQLDGMYFDDEMAGRNALDYQRGAQNALGNFSQTGNPKPLQDFYNSMYDDGIEVEITRNEDGTYDARYSNGKFSDNVSKEELLKATEPFFMGHPILNDLSRGSSGIMGGTAGGRGRFGGSTLRGRGGYGGYGGYKPDAYTMKVDGLARDLLAAGRAGSPQEARIMAHELAARKASMPPGEFYVKALQIVEPTDDQRSMMDEEEWAAALESAKEMAREMTTDYEERYLSGYNAGRMGGGAGADEPRQFDIPQDAVQDLLRFKDDPSALQEFDEIFGPGAAEAVLNANQ